MSLIKWSPFKNIEQFFDDDDFFRFPTWGSGNGWDLAVDVYEEDNNMIVKMQVPGIDADNIDINVEDNYLHVKGTREEEEETENKHYYSKQIRRGSFERSVRLPSSVEGKETAAEYEGGVLTVTIPKKKESTGTSVKVTKK